MTHLYLYNLIAFASPMANSCFSPGLVCTIGSYFFIKSSTYSAPKSSGWTRCEPHMLLKPLNNNHLLYTDTTLAALYSSEGSVMERHHLAQAMCILNTEGCDILQSLPRREFDRAIMMLRDNILSTDLSNYYK